MKPSTTHFAAMLSTAVAILLAIASSAFAAPPTHGPLPALDIEGLNHACGTAVDSEGDVYVSSAGDSKIYIFDPTDHQLGEQIAEIANTNEPCALAVDSDGNLYVSEKANGEVIRYTPDEYPFSSSPTFEPPEVIDSSGAAQGISVDPTDNRLYVAEGARISTYNSQGTLGRDEEQLLRFPKVVTGGTFTLSLGATSPTTTAPITYNPNAEPAEGAEALEAALEELGEVSPGDVSVRLVHPEEVEGSSYFVTFTGSLGSTDVGSITADPSGLEGDQDIVISELTKGFNGRIGEGELSDASGVGAYTSPSGDHYLSVADTGVDRIKVYSGSAITNLKPHETLDGSDEDTFKSDKTPQNGFGLDPMGAYLGVDPSNGHFFAYDHEHHVVDEFEASGKFFNQISSGGFEDAKPTQVAVYPQRNEVQHLGFEATGGSMKLEFDGAETTVPVDTSTFKPSAAELQAALESLPGIGSGNASVFGAVNVNGIGGSYSIAFTGALAGHDVPQLGVDASGLTGAGQTATVTTETPGSGPGRLYVGAGASASAQVLAFAPLAPPSRPSLKNPLSLELTNACGVAVDSVGNRYVAADKFIHVYDPSGAEVATIEDRQNPCDLAVDPAGNVYALDRGTFSGGDEQVVYYAPSSFPPTLGTKYVEHGPVATPSSFSSSQGLTSIGLNPKNGHLFVTQASEIIELGSVEEGSPILNPCFGCGLSIGTDIKDVAVYGENDDVYVLANFKRAIFVVNPAGDEIVSQINGAGSPKGIFSSGADAIAVDQSNGHLLLFNQDRGVAEEFEPSGAFVAEFGAFPTGQVVFTQGIAVDNSGGATDGDVYVAFLGAEPGAVFEGIHAFGPLSYGEAPGVEARPASAIGGGSATLNGAVNPHGVALEECKFEYLADSEYSQNLGESKPGFEGALQAGCVPDVAGIGRGKIPVAVHANISLAEPEERYRFRLLARNEIGEGADESLLGPPLVEAEPPASVLYTEAVLQAEIDPSGLATQYRFEYATTEGGPFTSTSTRELAPNAGPTRVQMPLTGLEEGTDYSFRVVAENEVRTVIEEGPDQTFETLRRAQSRPCENDEYRTGFSVGLPDCRAYELVTPAETRGLPPHAPELLSAHDWLTPPYGEDAGDDLTFAVAGTLPGFEGNGRVDGYRALRGGGSHPPVGWETRLFGPSFVQAGGAGEPEIQGVSADQFYAFWSINPSEVLEGTLPKGNYLLTPAGFEAVGRGAEGDDLAAEGRFLTPGGTHVIFVSSAHLAAGAPPAGAEAIYDRPAGSPQATVVSLKPNGSAFGEGEDATFLGATEDALTIIFKVNGALYARRDGETLEVAEAPNSFAGISRDGSHVFYAAKAESGNSMPPASLFSCRISGGPCAGPSAHPPTKIAEHSIFVNVSAENSGAYFTSKERLDPAEEGVEGEDNLYFWDGSSVRFVAILDPEDLVAFSQPGLANHTETNLTRWTASLTPTPGPYDGPENSPTRSTPDGGVLVFQSHARLTSYDNTEATAESCGEPQVAGERCSEVYLYDVVADGGKGAVGCLSCDPDGAPPRSDATLQSLLGESSAWSSTPIPNLTEDGDEVFFQTNDRLVPGDANNASDVYEWERHGTGGCEEPAGCLALISSGQGEDGSFLYGMTPNGNDVFFNTKQKLVGRDVPGSPSIYDARIGGGIPEVSSEAPCQGDACQGSGSEPPLLPPPATTGAGNGNAVSPVTRKPCAKGRHRVKGRCVRRHHKKHHRHTRHRRRAAR